MEPWSNAILSICLAHATYDLATELRRQGWRHGATVVRTWDELSSALGDAEVLVISGLWTDDMLRLSPRLRLVQSVSAGVDRYPLDAFRARGIRLASAQGVNANAVSDHAMALLLALSRKLHDAARDQREGRWRFETGDARLRERELEGMTLAVVGMGGIGGRLARLAQAFGMRVVGVRRNHGAGSPPGVELRAPEDLVRIAAEADVLALTCPLTPETEGLVSAEVIAAMRPEAFLINVARGRVVDEPALVAALRAGRIAGAGLDCFVEEPLAPQSPLWAMPNVIVTPHSAGETQHYERNVVRLLLRNLDAFERGAPLVNAVV